MIVSTNCRRCCFSLSKPTSSVAIRAHSSTVPSNSALADSRLRLTCKSMIWVFKVARRVRKVSILVCWTLEGQDFQQKLEQPEELPVIQLASFWKFEKSDPVGLRFEQSWTLFWIIVNRPSFATRARPTQRFSAVLWSFCRLLRLKLLICCGVAWRKCLESILNLLSFWHKNATHESESEGRKEEKECQPHSHSQPERTCQKIKGWKLCCKSVWSIWRVQQRSTNWKCSFAS